MLKSRELEAKWHRHRMLSLAIKPFPIIADEMKNTFATEIRKGKKKGAWIQFLTLWKCSGQNAHVYHILGASV